MRKQLELDKAREAFRLALMWEEYKRNPSTDLRRRIHRVEFGLYKIQEALGMAL